MLPWNQIRILLVLVPVLTSGYVFAQNTPDKNDSTKVYEHIETFSAKRGITRFVYQLFFKPALHNKLKKPAKRKVYKKLIQKPYSTFEGKIIRHIEIVTLDPFGYSVADTSVRKQGSLARAGNSVHIKSQHIAIRNLLLIRQNQAFNALLVKESERLVRSQGYITDVSFYVKTATPNSDSVDIFIRELDNWSIIPDGAISATSITLDLTDKNFMGLGHEAKSGFTWNDATGNYAYKVNYHIPNIRNTYISSTLHLATEESGNFTRSLGLDRPFFSPLAKWAAGAKFSQLFRQEFIHAGDSLITLQPFRYNMQDYWAGGAIQLFKGNTEEKRTTNFISTARFIKVDYFEKPAKEYDTQHFFSNENFYLASIGISTRKYVQDKYIFKFGIPEDVPVGKVYSITGGIQRKNNMTRKYLGARISAGNYYSWGYLSFNFEYGTYFHQSHVEQGVYTAGMNYFTGLYEIGKWKIRQFVKPQLTMGFNRFAYDSLTLNDGYGLDGFNSSSLSGTSRMLITFQTQAYAPWNVIGFRFGPYLAFSLGMLGDTKTGFRKSNVYSQIGLGVLIKNDHLIINTFQLSIAYYPSIPGNGQHVFKINSFRTVDFGFRDFEIGKPAVVIFQ